MAEDIKPALDRAHRGRTARGRNRAGSRPERAAQRRRCARADPGRVRRARPCGRHPRRRDGRARAVNRHEQEDALPALREQGRSRPRPRRRLGRAHPPLRGRSVGAARRRIRDAALVDRRLGARPARLLGRLLERPRARPPAGLGALRRTARGRHADPRARRALHAAGRRSEARRRPLSPRRRALQRPGRRGRPRPRHPRRRDGRTRDLDGRRHAAPAAPADAEASPETR